MYVQEYTRARAIIYYCNTIIKTTRAQTPKTGPAAISMTLAVGYRMLTLRHVRYLLRSHRVKYKRAYTCISARESV